MVKNYSIAGLEFSIRIPDERAYTEEGVLAAFAVESVRDPYVFEYEMADKLSPPNGACTVAEPGFRIYREGEGFARYIGMVANSWEGAYIRVACQGKNHQVQLLKSQFPGRVGFHTILQCMALEHLVIQRGGVLFHSSYIGIDGKAVLFTAPSQTGKSTQAELWRKHRGAEILNGDRSAVRIEDGKAVVSGIPFAGSSAYCKNRTLPLAAVVYLAQAPETTIRKLRGAEAFRRIWEGCSVNTWDKDDVTLASGTVMQVAASVPVYYLACTPDESAVTALERMLREKV